MKAAGWLDQSLRIIATAASVTFPLTDAAAPRGAAPSEESLQGDGPSGGGAPSAGEGLRQLLSREAAAGAAQPQLEWAVFDAAPAKPNQQQRKQAGSSGVDIAAQAPTPVKGAAEKNRAQKGSGGSQKAPQASASAEASASASAWDASAEGPSGRSQSEPPEPYSRGSEGFAQRIAVESLLAAFARSGCPPRPRGIPRVHCPDRAAFEARADPRPPLHSRSPEPLLRIVN